MHICILSGSARPNNNTIRVAYALKKLFDSVGHSTTVIDFISYDIPLINQGSISTDALTPFQTLLVNQMGLASLCIVITPEYNWSTTPELLNFLHRFGDKLHSPMFDKKVFGLVGVSTGKGGKAPALHLVSVFNKIISFLNLDSMVCAKIFESHFTKDVLDENGNSKENASYDKGLADFATYVVRHAERWQKGA